MAKTDQQIRSLINDIFLFGDGSFDQFDTKDLFELLVAADNAYHNTQQPIIDDAQYDALRRYAEMEDPTNNYFLGVGSEVRGGKVKLPYPMGSLTQAYEGDTMKWINQYKLTDKGIVVTEKLDGISCLLIYGQDGKLQIAYSRGDGIEGADITRHVSKINSVPKQVKFPCAIRAEIIFAKADWEIVKTKIKRSGGAFYKNARNATAGLMNASESDPIAYSYLSVVAYEIVNGGSFVAKNRVIDCLEDFGFVTPKSHTIEGWQCTDEFLTNLLNNMRTNSRFEIDGIVLEVNKMDLRSQINPTRDTLNPEYARKFKVADASNNAIAKVIEVQWNTSKNGYLKPRVKIEPVELVGVTVQHATGFNAKFIRDNKIGPGAKIRITRSGDVIPLILEVVEPMPEENM
jgi:NAD-dependent DNA ligase